MKVPLSWLNEFLSEPVDLSQAQEALLSVGLEVSNVQTLGQDLDGVVVGQVKSFIPHPNADRLRLCEVDTGDQTFTIVCGASNFSIGDKVALAMVGTILPNGVKIKKSKIRGEESFGMICSEEELGFSQDSQGILVLPQTCNVGEALAQALKVQDGLLELELTPNRGDCLSIYGVAREVAAALNINSKISGFEEEGKSKGQIDLDVQVPKWVPRYALVEFENICVKPSDLEIRRRLEKCGLRSINNVVDITNYVMLERGQPLHAFDADKVKGRIEVRSAKSGEEILCLDAQLRTLQEGDLVISDAAGPIAIAGVIGGERAAVNAQTKRIYLESAHFDASCVRRTAKRLRLNTDSSYRFERYVDPMGVWRSVSRARELLQKKCEGRVVAHELFKSGKLEPVKCLLRSESIRRILGSDVSKAAEYLTRLGFGVSRMGEAWQVEVPLRRPDVTREVDLVEEVARLHGYNHFTHTLPSLAGGQPISKTYKLKNKLKSVLMGMGLHECVTYSFSSKALAEGFAFWDTALPIHLQSSVNQEMACLRTSLIPSLLQVWKLNSSRQERSVALFELGKVYFRSEQKQYPAKEYPLLSVLLAGEALLPAWFAQGRCFDFFDGKGILHSLNLAVPSLDFKCSALEVPAFLHPGKSACLMVNGQRLGFLGEVHPSTLKDFDVSGPVVVLELDYQRLFPPSTAVQYTAYSAFPKAERDLAFVVPNETRVATIEQAIDAVRSPLLREVRLFDLYVGENLSQGKKSLAFRLTFASDQKTLTDEIVDGLCQEIVAKVETSCEALLRK